MNEHPLALENENADTDRWEEKKSLVENILHTSCMA